MTDAPERTRISWYEVTFRLATVGDDRVEVSGTASVAVLATTPYEAEEKARALHQWEVPEAISVVRLEAVGR